MNIHRFLYLIKNIPNALKHRFITQEYKVVTTLNKYHWNDKCEVMLYANMQLLVDFIEKEDAFNTIRWDSDDYHKNAFAEMSTIYNWWKNYEFRLKEIDEATHNWSLAAGKTAFIPSKNHPGYSELTWPNKKPEAERLLRLTSDMEEQLEKETEDMLIRLMKIRRCLWT